LTASIAAGASDLAAGETVSVSATFVASADAGPATVAIDVLGAGGDATAALQAASAQLTGCTGDGSTVTCAWDVHAGDGPQTLTVAVTAGAPAGAATLTMRALGALAGTAPTSLAETGLTVAGVATVPPPPPETTTTVVEPTATTVEEVATTAAPPATTVAPPPTATEMVPIEQAPVAAAAPARTTVQAPVSTRDDLPTTGTDSDRSLRLALAVVVGGIGLVMLARRERPASDR